MTFVSDSKRNVSGGEPRRFNRQRKDGRSDFASPRTGGFARKHTGRSSRPWERTFESEQNHAFGRQRDNDNGFGRKSSGAERYDGFRRPWERNAVSEHDSGTPREGGRRPWKEKADGTGRSQSPALSYEKNGASEHDSGASREGGRRSWKERANGTGRSLRPVRSWRKTDGAGRGFSSKRGDGFRRPWERRSDGDAAGDASVSNRLRIPSVPEGEIIFGRQPVLEMLRAGRRLVRQMVLADGIKDSAPVDEIQTLCREKNIEIIRHKSEILDSWLNSANHQGVAAVCEEYPYCGLSEIEELAKDAEGNVIFVILDHIADPQNLGSLLRSCEAGGVTAVILPSDRAAGVTPAAVRASAGAAEHLKIARVPNIVQIMEKLKGFGFWTTGLEASPEAKSYTEVDFRGKVCLVIGSEGHGLGRLVRERCDFLAQMPMRGKVNSLNAGVAGALAIYEVIKQQSANA